MKLRIEKSSHLLGTIQPLINEAEFYPLFHRIAKPGILITNYIFCYFGKPKEHGNLDSKQSSFESLRSAVCLLPIAAVASYHQHGG